jgi:hypothetical protein
LQKRSRTKKMFKGSLRITPLPLIEISIVAKNSSPIS